jgi:hypothetical protein
MKTKQINIYKYDELSDKVKDKVLSYFRDKNEFCFLNDELNESLNELLKDNGVKVLDGLKLMYSLSYSQGDGVMFEGNFQYKGVIFNVKHQGHYYHEYSKTIEYDDDGEDDLKSDLKQIIFNEFSELYLEICDKVKKLGYSAIEYENSEESIKDNIDANEYYFRENGEIEN